MKKDYLYFHSIANKHAPYLKNDAILKKIKCSTFDRNSYKNEKPIDIPNFNFVVSYKRPEVSVARVAIYHNT